jgi:hypothetical protein
LADQTIALPLQSGVATGRREEMVLHIGFLLAQPKQGPFQELAGELAEQLQREGLVLEITGPWPPYNFVGRTPTLDAG